MPSFGNSTFIQSLLPAEARSFVLFQSKKKKYEAISLLGGK